MEKIAINIKVRFLYGKEGESDLITEILIFNAAFIISLSIIHSFI